MKLITVIFFFHLGLLIVKPVSNTHTQKKTIPIKGSFDHKISGTEHNNSLRQKKNGYDKRYIPPRQLEVSLVKF